VKRGTVKKNLSQGVTGGDVAFVAICSISLEFRGYEYTGGKILPGQKAMFAL
jgi:hypothetical protein